MEPLKIQAGTGPYRRSGGGTLTLPVGGFRIRVGRGMVGEILT
jgi:hypothetical protein